MYLQRIYDHTDPENPKVVGVRLKANPGERQKFSPEFIGKAVDAGYCSLTRGKIVIHTEQGDVVYRITRTPGHYCCHCGKPQDDDWTALKHLVKTHAWTGLAATPGVMKLYEFPNGVVRTHVPGGEKPSRTIVLAPSPDLNNPFGYERLNAFDCVLEQGQDHRAGKPPARPRPAHAIRPPRQVP